LERVSNFLRRTSIGFRVCAIAALLLIALVITNGIVIGQMNVNSKRVIAEANLFEELEAAGGANRVFGDIRYWLTDLAVTQLTLSERNAKSSRAELDTYLKQLARNNPALAADIGLEADAYIPDAMQAVDAYADNSRVVGNSLLAKARAHANLIQDRLANLRDTLHDQTWAARDQAVKGATAATRAAVAIAIGVGLLSVILSLALFQSIVKPLRALNAEMGAMIGGRQDVAFPPLGDDQVGRGDALPPSGEQSPAQAAQDEQRA